MLLLAKKPENRARCAAAKLHTAFAAIGGAATMDKVESDLQNNFPIGWFEDKITREAENVGFLAM